MEQLHCSQITGLLHDSKAKRNALCTDWPEYLTKDNTLMINHKGEMALNKHSKTNTKFKDMADLRVKGIKTHLKFGMSKDSPFLNGYTEKHPGTK